jgi:hypothetical protein
VYLLQRNRQIRKPQIPEPRQFFQLGFTGSHHLGEKVRPVSFFYRQPSDRTGAQRADSHFCKARFDQTLYPFENS